MRGRRAGGKGPSGQKGTDIGRDDITLEFRIDSSKLIDVINAGPFIQNKLKT